MIDKRLSVSVSIFIFLLVGLGVVYFHMGPDSDAWSYAYLFSLGSLDLLLMWSAILFARKFGFKFIYSKMLFFFSGFAIFDLLAETYWYFAGYPLLSIADLLFFAAYVCLFMTSFIGFKLTCLNQESKTPALLKLIGSYVVIVALFFLLVPNSWLPDLSFIGNLAVSGYVVMDLIIIINILFILLAMADGLLSRGWMLLISGLMMTTIGDFMYLLAPESFAFGQLLVDFAWLIAAGIDILVVLQFRIIFDDVLEKFLPVSISTGKSEHKPLK